MPIFVMDSPIKPSPLNIIGTEITRLLHQNTHVFCWHLKRDHGIPTFASSQLPSSVGFGNHHIALLDSIVTDN